MLPLINACSSTVRNSDRLHIRDNFSKKLSPDLYNILLLASLAPSSHNSQPWLVQIIDNRHIIIKADSSRSLPVVDPHHRELFLSLGCFIENLILAAQSIGLAAEITTMGSAPSSATTTVNDWQTSIQFSTAPSYTYPKERIKQRRTLRSGYQSQELHGNLVKKFTQECQSSLIYIPRNSQAASHISEITTLAFSQQTARDKAQIELSKWIRFSHGEASRLGDGLTPAMMEINGIAGWFVQHFYRPDDVIKETFRIAGNEKTSKQVQQGAGWLLLTCPNNTPEQLIHTGRRCERIFLLAREHGLALHPMSQALEEVPYTHELTNNLNLSETIQFILRCGYVDTYPKPVSFRRGVSQFTSIREKS